MSIQETYRQEILPEIESFKAQVEQALSADPEKASLLKGWRVFFSPLIEKPAVLFIGINPGAGEAGDDLEPDSNEVLEYVREKDSDYALARETRTVFTDCNLLHILNESAVKTNAFYLTTTGENDLYTLLNYLGRSDESSLGERAFEYARRWTKKLIEMTRPSVVICEGKGAYKFVTEEVFGNSDQPSWTDWQDSCATTAIPKLNLTVLGYSRRFSNIRNKAELCKHLRRLLAN